jgi:hypothetical protein
MDEDIIAAKRFNILNRVNCLHLSSSSCRWSWQISPCRRTDSSKRGKFYQSISKDKVIVVFRRRLGSLGNIPWISNNCVNKAHRKYKSTADEQCADPFSSCAVFGAQDVLLSVQSHDIESWEDTVLFLYVLRHVSQAGPRSSTSKAMETCNSGNVLEYLNPSPLTSEQASYIVQVTGLCQLRKVFVSCKPRFW